MQERKPFLDTLKARFFSWAQTMEVEVVRTKDLVKALKLTPMQEAHTLTYLSEDGSIVQLMRGVYLVPQTLPPGGKWTPSAYRIIEALMKEIKANYQITGLAAFNFPGLDNQVANEIAAYNTKLSGRRQIGELAFWFIKVPNERLGGQQILGTPPDTQVVIGNLPRVVMDAIYDYSRFDLHLRAYQWIAKRRQDFRFLDQLVDYSIRYGNVSTRRRLGYVLDKLQVRSLSKKLEQSIRKTKSFIPLVPGEEKKGPVDTKWGIIANREIKYEPSNHF